MKSKFADQLGIWGDKLSISGLHTIWLMQNGINFYILMSFVREGLAVEAQMEIQQYIDIFADIAAPITPTLILTGSALPPHWEVYVKYKVR